MAAVFLSLFIAVPSSTQDVDSYAFLLVQPRFHVGLPLLPANTIGHFAARYEVSGRTVDVYVAPDAPGFRSDDDVAVTDRGPWSSIPCGIIMERAPQGRGGPVARALGEDYALYITGLDDDSALCGFATRFVATFDFFLEALGNVDRDAWTDPEVPPDRAVPQFPGVLELTG